MMVMKTILRTRIHRQCPYCLGINLEVTDYDVANEAEKRLGDFKFILKCKNCGGTCMDINSLETNRELREKNKQKELTNV